MNLAPVTPQPTKSSSYSRTNRVIDELQRVWDVLQKELVSVRTQLESAREAKKMHDQQSKSYIQSNQECRHHIETLMTLLESKQQGLKETKQVSTSLETQAKQLKDAAVEARQQADALKKQETQLGQAKEAAVMRKARVVQQHKVLQQAVNDLDQRARLEHCLLRKQLGHLQKLLDQVVARNQLVLMLATTITATEETICKKMTAATTMTTQRQAWLQHVRGLQHRLLVQDSGVHQLRSDLDGCLSAAAVSGGDGGDTTTATITMDQRVTQCQDEVHGLIQRIQSYSLVMPH